MTQTPPAGWYPDPSGQPGVRWWDGTAWTDQTAAAPPAPQVAAPAPSYGVPAPAAAPGYGNTPYGSAPYGSAPYGSAPYGGGSPYSTGPAQGRSLFQRNRFAMTTAGFSIAYIAIAVATHFVFIGIVPALMAYRSLRFKEPLAPLAIVLAALAIIVSVSALA